MINLFIRFLFNLSNKLYQKSQILATFPLKEEYLPFHELD